MIHNFSRRRQKQIIDIETIDAEPIMPLLDLEKSRQNMDEFQKLANFVIPEDNDDWEEKIEKIFWTPIQTRVFSKAVQILNSERLISFTENSRLNKLSSYCDNPHMSQSMSPQDVHSYGISESGIKVPSGTVDSTVSSIATSSHTPIISSFGKFKSASEPHITSSWITFPTSSTHCKVNVKDGWGGWKKKKIINLIYSQLNVKFNNNLPRNNLFIPCKAATTN